MSVAAGFAEAPEPSNRRRIPFDYAFRYELKGKPDEVLVSTVTVSIEAEFVAVSIGYGAIPKVTPITFGPDVTVPLPPPGVIGSFFLTTFPLAAKPGPSLRDVPLGLLFDALAIKLPETSRLLRRETGPEAVLKNGFKLNPQIAERALLNEGRVPLEPDSLRNLFQVVGSPPEQILFKYALHDDGTGREFQSEPILNVAGLGSADGDRPFRYFAQPIRFAPQSRIRMEVTEVSDFTGELHVSLHGYKLLGGAGTPTGRTRRIQPGRRRLR